VRSLRGNPLAQGVPKEILEGYQRRKFRYHSDRQDKAKIDHLMFWHQPGRHGDEFWKGVEYLIFDTEDGRLEYRICYWANRGRGRWWKWGQFATIMPLDIYKRLTDYIAAHSDGNPK
jgi:hypothetical protein